jgi:branched-chain amino acid transport system substrate-binding protein
MRSRDRGTGIGRRSLAGAVAAVLTIAGGSQMASAASATKGRAQAALTSAASGVPIKIGVLNTQSGSSALPEFTDGLQAYVDSWNAAGGFHGHPIELVVGDLTSDPATATAAGHALVAQDNVVAVLSTNSNLTCTSDGQYLSSQGVPVLSNSIDPGCTSLDNFFGFMNPSIENAIPAEAWLIDQGAKSTAFLVPDFPGVQSQANGMQAYAKSKGVKFRLQLVPATATAADYDAAIASLKHDGVNGVFSLAIGSAYSLIIESAVGQGFYVKNGVKWIYGPTLYTPSTISAIPQLAEGGGILTQTIPFETGTPAIKAIDAKLSTNSKTVDGFSALAWNQGAALQQVFSHLNGTTVTRQSLMRAFEATKTVTLPLSTVHANLSSRSNPSAGAVVEVKNGKFVVESPFFTVRSGG